jgi:hypothetical protein
MKYFSVLLFFITNFLFSQEIISFDDFDTGDYANGIMYVEIKIYENNINLADKYRQLIDEMPAIEKYFNGDNTIYTFTGYTIDNANNVSIINVKLKLSDFDLMFLENELLHGFNIDENEAKTLIEHMDEVEDYVIEGKDINGSFTVRKRLYVNDTFEIEDNFGMIYAYILFSNFSNIDRENISRRLMYYILEYTY